jgi:hypothetical protein
MAKRRVCAIEGCHKPHEARNLCNYHYRKLVDVEELGMRYAPKGAAKAFVAEVLKSDTDDCILWPYTMDKDSYGVTQWEGRQWGVHRLVCFLRHGEPPPYSMARHECRVRSCVNPNHLSWGTSKDNADDRDRHGTTCRGEARPASKLTEEAVRFIRSSSERTTDLAEKFGVTDTCISYARLGKTWRHVI